MTEIIPITPASSIEEISSNMDMLAAMKSRIRDLERQFKEQLLEYIQTNGSVTIGTTRYYAGTEKETNCFDVAGAVEALMIACGGDLRLFCGLLAKGGIKPGAAKAMLPDSFHNYFVTEEKVTLETGKPTKKVLSVPTNL